MFRFLNIVCTIFKHQKRKKESKSRVLRKFFRTRAAETAAMNYAAVKSAQWNGQNSETVHVECTQTLQLPSFRFSGAPASAAVEMRDRLMAAFSSCGLRLPSKRIIVGFTPRTRSPYQAFDLPVALAVLAAANVIPRKNLEKSVFLGALGLDGSLVEMPGMSALAAEFSGGVAVPWASSGLLNEDQLTAGGGFKNLQEVIAFFRSDAKKTGLKTEKPQLEAASGRETVLVEDIVGQLKAKRLLTIAAAGGHYGIFAGPHGWGKSLLARALWGLLPELTEAEQRELRRIYASTGLVFCGQPPFRSVDSSFSTRMLLGGNPSLGEIALAHRGVLFLDELMEWPRARLENLRIPLESGSFLPVVIAATNTCPCGRAGSSVLLCQCSEYERERYQRHISGALLDRFDLSAEVVDHGADEEGISPKSAELKERVSHARRRMLHRQGTFNRDLRGEEIFTQIPWKKSALRLAKEVFRKRGLTRRGYIALARVSVTICDLRGGESVNEPDVYEAAHFHPQNLFTRYPLLTLR